MGTDMHVAIEVRRPEYDFKTKSMQPKWKFITGWTVDRWYDLFGAFDVRSMWSNSLDVHIANDMSYYLQHEKDNYCYGFYEITPDFLDKHVLGWSPPIKEWEEIEDYDRPTIEKGWLFDMYVPTDVDEGYYTDKVYLVIYKRMLKLYGRKNVRLVIYFDS